MNKRQIKKLMKRNQIKFNKIKLNKDDILVINFKNDFDNKFVTNFCNQVKYNLFPKNKILPLCNGISIGVIERGELDGKI